MRVEYRNGELDLQYIQRGNVWYLRLVTPHKKNGVRVFAQRGLRPTTPAKDWFYMFRKLYEDVIDIHRKTLGGG